MERTWTIVGKEHTEGKEEELGEMFNRLEWHGLPYTMAAMPGLAIKLVIKELRIPNVTQVSCSHELAPYGLMGIKARYKNGDAIVYLVDEGCQTLVLASDFYPNSDLQG